MPEPVLHFEDFPEGEVVWIGGYEVTAEEIKEYAAEFDQQPFHLDEELAKDSVAGELSASGWHTAAAYMRQCADHNFAGRDAAAAEGKELPPLGVSPGFENLQWLRPVFPGDTVTYFNEITSKRELRSRQDWGLVMAHNTGFNQDGVKVFSFDGKLLVARRS